MAPSPPPRFHALPRATAGRHARWRRGLARAVVVAIAAHAAVLLFARLPVERGQPAMGPLLLVPQPVEVERPAAERVLADHEATLEERRGAAAGARPAGSIGAPIPAIRESPAARTETTIPSTVLIELRAATLPLVGSGGEIGRRRLDRSAEEIAIARADSLLFARMAGLVTPARETGAIGLANGGITVAIPWQGFLHANRRDDRWRAERCADSDDGEADKAGEGEARRAQCG